jgi:REP element-mobilizing transposase RayT
MARRLRIHLPGGFYHVTLRGNHQQAIFLADGHHDLLDRIVAEAAASEDARIHAYCWMTNHIHLLTQVSGRPLGRLMLRIASRYARTVQSHMATTGHLFERRYHASLVDADRYLLAIVRYIHLNPVEAGLVSDPAAWRWSSHRAYLGQAASSWLTTRLVMEMLGSRNDCARRQYLALMNTSTPEADNIGTVIDAGPSLQILGDDKFAQRATNSTSAPCARRSLDAILAACVARFGIPLDLLASPGRARQLSVARAWLAHQVVANRAASISAVARLLDRTEGSIRQLMSRHPPDPDAV